MLRHHKQFVTTFCCSNFSCQNCYKVFAEIKSFVNKYNIHCTCIMSIYKDSKSCCRAGDHNSPNLLVFLPLSCARRLFFVCRLFFKLCFCLFCFVRLLLSKKVSKFYLNSAYTSIVHMTTENKVLLWYSD